MAAIDQIMDSNAISTYTPTLQAGTTLTVPDVVYNSEAVQVANIRPFNSVSTVEDSEIDTMISELLDQIEGGEGYYIYLDGKDENYSVSTDNGGQVLYVPFETNGTLKVLSYTPQYNFIGGEIINNELELVVIDNVTSSPQVSVVTVGIEEDATVTKTITITQTTNNQ